jgi:hypothetical protein
MKEYYEVNTVLNTDGEIATSNTFTDFDEAQQFYESIDDDEMKEFLKVDENGFFIREIDCNYGH